jgi:hypothetical protein
MHWTIGVIQWTIGVIQWTIGVIQWTIGVFQWTIRIFLDNLMHWSLQVVWAWGWRLRRTRCTGSGARSCGRSRARAWRPPCTPLRPSRCVWHTCNGVCSWARHIWNCVRGAVQEAVAAAVPVPGDPLAHHWRYPGMNALLGFRVFRVFRVKGLGFRVQLRVCTSPTPFRSSASIHVFFWNLINLFIYSMC